MKLYPISACFINKMLELTWCDIKWGYEKNLITLELAIIKAEKLVTTGNYTEEELELSFLMHNESNYQSLFPNKLCTVIDECEIIEIRKKWLYLILSWLWANRDKFEDPLGEVEGIYADFEYPVEIESFIKYMPPSDDYDPSLHSQEENINRLMDNWAKYLKDSALKFI